MPLKYREPDSSDLLPLQSAIAADPQHQDSNVTFWLPTDDEGKRKAGTKCIAVEDTEGVVFYIKLENVVRAYVQFVPGVGVERTGKALREAFAFIAVGAKASGYLEMIFDTVSAGLIRMTRKFGFKPMKDSFQVKL